MQGQNRVEKMSTQAIVELLAQIKGGARITVRHGEAEGSYTTLYGEIVVSKSPRNWSLAIQKRVVLDSGSVLQESEEGWIFCEKGLSSLLLTVEESAFVLCESGL